MAETTTTPPMDEILASIRRIITDENPVGEQPAGHAAGSGEAEDVLELGEPRPAIPVTSSPSHTPVAEPSPLLSQQTQAASQRALAALSGIAIDPAADTHTLDGLVRELLRPMLKDWLDAHLPEIVERLVAREVARISGR